MRVIFVCLVAACSQYTGPVCSEPSCKAVAKHLESIEAERDHSCGSYREFLALVRIGEPAVPALKVELDSDSVRRVRTAVDALIELGHATYVAAWCRTLGEDDRGLACADM